MARLEFRIETRQRIGVRYAARVLVSLATIREGLRIAEEGEGGWVDAPLKLPIPTPVGSVKPLKEYLSEIGHEFLLGNVTVETIDPRDRAVALAIGVFDRSARLDGTGSDNAPYLRRLTEGTLEGVIEDFFTWLFGVQETVRSIGSRSYESVRRILQSGKGSPAVGAGLVLVGSVELQATLQSLKASDFKTEVFE